MCANPNPLTPHIPIRARRRQVHPAHFFTLHFSWSSWNSLKRKRLSPSAIKSKQRRFQVALNNSYSPTLSASCAKTSGNGIASMRDFRQNRTRTSVKFQPFCRVKLSSRSRMLCARFPISPQYGFHIRRYHRMNPVDLCTGHELIDRELSPAKTFAKGFNGDIDTHTRTKLEEIRHRLRR